MEKALSAREPYHSTKGMLDSLSVAGELSSQITPVSDPTVTPTEV